MFVAGAFSAFAAISALSVVFVHRFVPETSRKTLEQIELLFDGDGEARGEVELGNAEHLVHRRWTSVSTAHWQLERTKGKAWFYGSGPSALFRDM